jgi:hypothetical protein
VHIVISTLTRSDAKVNQFIYQYIKYEAQTALFKDPVRTSQ